MILKSDTPIGTEIAAESTPDVKLPDSPLTDHVAEPDANVAFTCVEVVVGGMEACQVYRALVVDNDADVSFKARALTASDERAGPRVMDTSYGQLLSPEGLPVEKIALKPFVPTPSVPQPPIAVPV